MSEQTDSNKSIDFYVEVEGSPEKGYHLMHEGRSYPVHFEGEVCSFPEFLDHCGDGHARVRAGFTATSIEDWNRRNSISKALDDFFEKK